MPAAKRGQSILYTVLLLPTLMLVLVLAVDLGTLQLQKLRLRAAVDMATTDAATTVDAGYYSQTGRLRFDVARAEEVAREYLYRNLLPLTSTAGGGRAAAATAQTAQIAVVNSIPGRDPFTGARLDRPAICAQVRIRFRTGLLHWVGAPDELEFALQSEAEIRS